ncbi:MAG: hypothetical protein DGJ47_000462 [Rickettsiaceae bacterium]
MTITKQHLIELSTRIEEKVAKLLLKIEKQQQTINDLQQENITLKKSNKQTVAKVKEYISELEKIRAYYANENI